MRISSSSILYSEILVNTEKHTRCSIWALPHFCCGWIRIVAYFVFSVSFVVVQLHTLRKRTACTQNAYSWCDALRWCSHRTADKCWRCVCVCVFGERVCANDTSDRTSFAVVFHCWRDCICVATAQNVLHCYMLCMYCMYFFISESPLSWCTQCGVWTLYVLCTFDIVSGIAIEIGHWISRQWRFVLKSVWNMWVIQGQTILT